MLIPHWLIGVAIFAGLAAVIGFAFRQGMRVKPDRDKDPDEWTTLCRWRPAVRLFWPFRLTVGPKAHGPRQRPGGRRIRSPQWRACGPGRSGNTRADAKTAASHPVRDRCSAHPRSAFGYDVLPVRSWSVQRVSGLAGESSLAETGARRADWRGRQPARRLAHEHHAATTSGVAPSRLLSLTHFLIQAASSASASAGVIDEAIRRTTVFCHN
jgi:hypothetical protein